MPAKIILGLLLGGGIGLAIGYFGRCSTGTCPLTTNPYITTVLGALIGATLVAGTPRRPAYADGTQSKSAHVLIATDATFREALGTGPTLVAFSASRCHACQTLAPVFDDLANEYHSRARFVKVDVDQSIATAHAHGVEALPTLILFREGQPVGDPVVGFRSAGDLRRLLDQAIEPS